MACFSKIRIAAGIVLLPLLWAVFAAAPVRAADPDFSAVRRPHSVNIIISGNIRPYMEAAEAMRAALDARFEAGIHVYKLYRYKAGARKALAEELNNKGPQALFIAVGPEAALFLWQEAANRAGVSLYSIVLNPESLAPELAPACGLSLNIPPAVQLECICKSFPKARRIGLFYDPQYNRELFEKAASAAGEKGVVLVPLRVSSKKDIPGLLSAEVHKLDAVWLVPDRTVISESIAQHIIKQSILQGVPVVGYNKFFYDSGAAAAFVFDYTRLGRQTAETAVKVMQEGGCRRQVPEFEVWINKSVYKKLDIALPDLNKPLVVGP
ncbi:MAG: ABC transporter substrate binding protein [Desulfosalsimonadaceae bacterium]